MQKRAVRIIMKVNRYYHTNSLFYELRLLKLDDLINLKAIKIMYKAKYVLLLKNIHRLFQIVQNQRYETRQTRQFSLQYVRTNFKSMSVSVYRVKLWNSLNDDWKTCNNEYYLKKKYIEKVLKEYQNVELGKETSTV